MTAKNYKLQIALLTNIQLRFAELCHDLQRLDFEEFNQDLALAGHVEALQCHADNGTGRASTLMRALSHRRRGVV